MPIKLNTASGGGVILQGANTASDKTITIPADDGTMIYANSSGNVGIGTSSPTTIAGYQSLTVNGSTSGLISIKYNGTDGGYLYADSSSFNIDGKSTTPNVVFKTNGAERLRIDSSGNVGIGTSSPSTKLDINNGSLNLSVGYNLQWGGNGNQAIAYTSSSLVFYNGAERARIDSSGNLLVGVTSTPSSTVGGVQISSANQTRFSFGAYTGAGDYIYFINGNGTVGRISSSGSTTSYVTTSDYRLKDNIAPMTGALAKVAALKPCTYTWKADGSAGEGFIAHELAEVVPDAVTGEKDAVNEDGSIKPQGIDTSFLVATLTAAIQELKAEVDSLRAQVEAK